MFKFIKSSSVAINSLPKLNCQTKCAINKTFIRGKRQTFSRRPVKILTDSGKDYFKEYDYKESISSADLELKPNALNPNDRKVYNKYFDEGFAEDFSDEPRNDENYRKELSPESRPKRPNEKIGYKVSDNKSNELNKSSEKLKENKKFSQTSGRKSEKVFKSTISGIPVYEKLGENNREFIEMMSNIKTRRKREKIDLMALEGKRLISDAIKARIELKTIYFSKEENLVGIEDLDRLVFNGLKLKKIFYNDIKLFSELTTSPGIIAVGKRPDYNKIANLFDNSQKLPIILIADNIRDPGNMGTLIRCAAGVGALKLVLMKGCVDAWESKVLRSGAGAHFRLQMANDVEWPMIFNHIPIDRPFDLFIADSNESLAAKTSNKGYKRIAAESDIPSHTMNTIMKDFDEKTKETVLRDDSYDDSNPDLLKYKNSSIASTSYCETKFFSSGAERPTVLVIGGETLGLSNQSYKLAYDYIGRKIKIPLELGVDSLNSAVAGAVIMYEMKRQFQMNHISSSDQIVAQNV